MRPIIPLLSTLLILINPIPTWAKQIVVGNQVIELPSPDKHCFLDRDLTADRRIFNFFEKNSFGQNILLAATAQCDELEEWRNGERPTLGSYTMAMAPKEFVDVEFDISSGEYAKQMREAMDLNNNSEFIELLNQYNEKLKRKLREIRVQETTPIGILGKDKNSFYYAFLTKLTTETGSSKIQVGIMAPTLIKGKAVTLYVYDELKNEDTLSASKTTAQEWIQVLHSAN